MAMLIREEVEHQERLEAAGYRSPTWRMMRAQQTKLPVEIAGLDIVGRVKALCFWGGEAGAAPQKRSLGLGTRQADGTDHHGSAIVVEVCASTFFKVGGK